ncbi:MAG: polysaccharide biosynthesis/export family protein [Acidobacteria bacterium]|nr:polysaccharide biosynthesis/export family protein [Acidobacteriota bacterium]
MRDRNRVPVVFAVGFILLLTATGSAQRNNPFSANPDTRNVQARVQRPEPEPVVITSVVEQRAIIPAATTDADPTRTYKVAPGDTLYIVLANAPNASGYYSVRADGSIDFPLAGDGPNVQGMNTGEIERSLSSDIKLYRDAHLQVTVREFGSHKINVTGLVERNGERFLQREAMPLFTVKADVGVNAWARNVTITHASGSKETHDLRDIRTDDVLVCAGDVIEFAK